MMQNRNVPNRVSVGSISSAHARQPHPRSHSHSLSVGSLNPTHRVGRRKSTSSNASSAVAVAAVNIVAGNLLDGVSGSLKHSGRRTGVKGVNPAFAASLPAGNGFAQAAFDSKASAVLVDGPPLDTLPETEKLAIKSRERRASEGSRLIKGEGKRASSSELKCEKCGKGYKHSSCLYKHLWEHTPEWAITSKLLISKHQQVQLLEAASVLMTMNQDGSDSDGSSPAASASDPHSDVLSSAGNTPPPQAEEQSAINARGVDSKRFSSNSSVLSHSYQSVFSEAHNTQYRHSRQVSHDNRPTTSSASVTGSYTDEEEREDMSAAFNLLSCSYGTPKTGPISGQSEVPPVPPLPAKYLGKKSEQLSGSTITGVTPHGYDSFIRGRQSNAEVDMMDEDDHPTSTTNGRSDDEEEGMFGKMEY